MHPRQRSKCFVTVAFSVIDPSRRASIRWMRPRVHLLVPEHVRRARRQAEPAVDAVGGQLPDHAASTPRGSSSRRIASTTVRTAAGVSSAVSCGRTRRPTPGARSPPGAKRASARRAGSK